MNKKIFLLSVVNLILVLIFGCAKEEEIKVIKKPEKKPVKTEMTAPKEAPKEAAKPEETVTTNPFLTPYEEEVFKNTANRLSLDYLNLSAIFYSPSGSQAVIDGRIYKAGDIVDNKKIIEIKTEEVILKDEQGEYTLKMRGVLEK